MGSFILNLAPYFWMVCFFTLLAGLLTRLDKSSLITLTIWLVSGLLMDKIAPLLMEVEDKRIARTLWYLTWVVIDIACIALILLTHKQFQLAVSKFTLMVSTTYLALMIVQGARYIDRMVLKTDLLSTFYMYAVPVLNIGVMVFGLVWLLKNLHQSKGNTGS
ncbi:hypothetical protein [Shewanella xiamenensis]|uniref:hypothetical protein n=1 Tax=Shewanella xiamenensis TaxID=332186 RepID=UPI001558A054|nr:hypothetical protein [Shewanella xiamenensis]UML92124.1 hypothetical protein MKD32_11695 [Shewanella xiamenensis]